jgi:hypothetical protein
MEIRAEQTLYACCKMAIEKTENRISFSKK